MPELQSAAQILARVLPGIPILPKMPLDIVAEQAVKAGRTLDLFTRDAQKRYVTELLRSCGWNQCQAAKLAGVHRNTLHRYIAELGIVLEGAAPTGRKPAQKEGA